VSSDNTPPAITQERRGDIAVITMDDGKANALGHARIRELHEALDAAEGARALVLAGRPGKFCAGFDLSVVKEGPEAATEMMHRGAEVALRFHEWEVPRVFAVTGHALAMGAVLLGCADHRIGAAGDFKYGFNEVAIGLPMPEFAIALHRDRLSPRQLHAAVALARIYDTRGALEAGFIDEVVEPDEVVDTAIARAAELADYLDPAAFRRTRRTMDAELTERLRRLTD